MTSRVGEIYDQVKAAMDRSPITKSADDDFVKYLLNGHRPEDPETASVRDELAGLVLAALRDHPRFQVVGGNVFSTPSINPADEYEVHFRIKVRPYDVMADMKKAVGK
jgi:hypothetical protein